VASVYLLFWPVFLGILKSPKIFLVPEDLVSMAAMTESSCAWKEKNFLVISSGRCIIAFCTSHKIQLPGTANGGRRFDFISLIS
jgi:hypothetical protein